MINAMGSLVHNYFSNSGFSMAKPKREPCQTLDKVWLAVVGFCPEPRHRIFYNLNKDLKKCYAPKLEGKNC